MTGSRQPCLPPKLVADDTLAKEFCSRLGTDRRPVILLHTGARIAVRRWPEASFRDLILRLRHEFDFQLVLIPDPDGYGAGLAGLADHTLDRLTLPELLAVLSCATQVICNDSGPSHLADALGIPVIAFFGPARPEWFRPFRPHNLVVIRDLCPLHPCADYCRFPEHYCLTKLTPDLAWPEIQAYLRDRAQFPPRGVTGISK